MKFKLAIAYLLLIFFASCKTKQSVSEKVFVKESDSLILRTTVLEQPPTLATLTINEVCDSVTSKPKDFKQVFVVSGDTLELSIKNNELILNVNRLKRQLEKTKEELSKKDSELVSISDKKIVHNVIPFKYWVWLILAILYGLGMTYLWIRK